MMPKMDIRIFDNKMVIAEGTMVDITPDESEAIRQIFGSIKKCDSAENELYIMDTHCCCYLVDINSAISAKRKYAKLKYTAKKNDPNNFKDHTKVEAKYMDGREKEVSAYLDIYENKLKLFNEQILEIKELLNKKLQNESKFLGIFMGFNQMKKDHILKCREAIANLIISNRM